MTAMDPFPAYDLMVRRVFASSGPSAYPLLRYEGAAEYLGITVDQMRSIVKSGRMRFLRMGAREGLVRFSRADLDTFRSSEFLQQAPPRLRAIPGRPRVVSDGKEIPYDRFLQEQRKAVEDGSAPGEACTVGWIYFVGAAEVGRIKIGHTANHPDQRLDTLRTSAPTEIAALGILRGTARVERAIHRHFAGYRWHREWFRDEHPLRAFIKAFATPVRDGVDDLLMHPDDAEALYRATTRLVNRWVAKSLPARFAANPSPAPEP
jgi:excisionase family DNA binding protein